MLIITTRGRAAPGRQPDLVAAAREMQDATQADDGCLSYGFFFDIQGVDVVVGVEVWHDRASLAAHMEHAHTRRFLDRVAELTVGEPTMTFYDAEPTVGVAP